MTNPQNPFDAIVTAIPAGEEFYTVDGEGVEDVWEVILNRGRSDDWSVGDQVLLFALGPRIQDPASGEDLGCFEVVRGKARVTHVQERMCTVRSMRTQMRPANALMPNIMGEVPMTERPVPFSVVRIGDFARLI